MDSSPPSEVDYAERVAMENNRMDIELSTMPTTHASDIQAHTNDNEVVLNTLCQSDPSTMPISPSAILYEANVLADPNLWDGHFGSVSLFGTNEFLLNDTHNISCSLICIAEFIKQRCITNWDGNKIQQLDTFGEVAFTFISAIYEAGWDKLNTTDKTNIGCKIKSQFAKQATPHSRPIKKLVEKIPPPIPKRLPCKQVDEIRNRLNQRNKGNSKNKTYVQVSSLAANILKLRDAFSTLPNRKIIEIH